MSYPEFMQRRSTKSDAAIVEDVDVFGLPSQQQDPNSSSSPSASSATQNKKMKCVKDIWHAAIEGDVECLEANLKLGASISQLGQPILTASANNSNSGSSAAHGTTTSSGVQPIWGPLFDRCALFRATPLQFACAYNRIEAAKFLLDQGASWEQLSSTGVSAKDYARRRNYIEILKLIEQKEIERKQ
jgi:hypothetical protein